MEQNLELLPLTNDFVFKRVFTKDGNENLLKSLLSAILDIEIKEIEIKNPELTKVSKEAKLEILDIRAKINNNTMIDIEVQVQNHKNIDKRAMSYISKMYADQLEVGSKYQETLKTISINILNFNYFKRNTYHSIGRMKFEKTEKEKYVDVGFTEDEEYATKDIEVHYIELPKFIKKNPGVETKLSQWLWLISGKGEKVDMAKEKNEDVKKASEELERISNNEEERWLYFYRQRKIKDENSLYDSGVEKGREEGKLETAKRMLEEGISIEIIIKITGLKKEDIEKIQT